MEEEQLRQSRMPDNVIESKRYFGFRRRNWIEGIICVFIAGFIIASIPFVTRVKIIFMICICGPLLLLNLIGLKDQSISEIFLNLKNSISLKGRYHLRHPAREERYKSHVVEQSVNGIGHGDSAADKTGDFLKEKYAQLRNMFKEREIRLWRTH